MNSSLLCRVRVVFWAFSIFLLCGCTCPIGTIDVKLFPKPTEKNDIVFLNDRRLREAVAIIDGVVKQNGYTFKNEWSDQTPGEWWAYQSYKHKNPSVRVNLWYHGLTGLDKARAAGKRSVEMSVTFYDHDAGKQLSPEVRRVCDDLVEELAKRYGNENVRFLEGRTSMRLN